MSESLLMTKSKEFALTVIRVCKELRSARCESALINQFLRAGTSIGANIREAQYAHGKADFVARLQIALKEANETGYWLELLFRTGYIDENKYQELDIACTAIRVLLIHSIRTAKGETQSP